MKNACKIEGDTAVIYVTRRNGDKHQIIIDAADLPTVRQYRSWSVHHITPTRYYATTLTPREIGKGYDTVLLARLLLRNELSDGLVVQYLNGNPLDCRRENLRVTTKAEALQCKTVAGGCIGERCIVLQADGKWYHANVRIRGEVHSKLFTDLQAAKQWRNELFTANGFRLEGNRRVAA